MGQDGPVRLKRSALPAPFIMPGQTRCWPFCQAQSGETVLMLGHNPGIAGFAQHVVRHGPDHARFYDYPTCATAVIRFNITNWADVTWRSGAVLGFTIPRELLE